jgi:hypothetical protein
MKEFLMRNGVALLFNLITIVVMIVALAVAWGKITAEVSYNAALIQETRADIKVFQLESKANAVQFAEIQKDLTEIRKDLSYIQALLTELRDEYIREDR